MWSMLLDCPILDVAFRNSEQKKGIKKCSSSVGRVYFLLLVGICHKQNEGLLLLVPDTAVRLWVRFMLLLERFSFEVLSSMVHQSPRRYR